MHTKNEYVSYAMDFASYLIGKVNGIDGIILHGSIAREDFDEESDIDLFIDTEQKNEKKIKSILESYYKTKKFKEWELKGIKKEISIIVGRLDNEEWKDLKRAIVNTGISLYSKYKSEVEKINQYTLLSFENIKPDKKRISIHRKLFGFTVGNKKYDGLIKNVNGVKIGKGAILVPVEHLSKIKKYFQDKKVTVKLYDLWSDNKFG